MDFAFAEIALAAVAVCCGVPLIALWIQLKVQPNASVKSQMLLTTLFVPGSAILLTVAAIYLTYRAAIQSGEDGYQLIMFTWLLIGGFFIAAGLPLGFVTGRIARRWFVIK